MVAISVDPVETSDRHARRMGYTFPLLSDAGGATIRRYDLLHPKAGPKHEVLGTNSIGEPSRTSIAIADGKLFLRGEKHLFCITNKTGSAKKG